VGNQNGKKRRGFTIRDDSRPTTKDEAKRRMREHLTSKSERGERKSGLVKDRLIAQIGPGKYGELLKQLQGVTSD
jgi:hypothetical protein